MTIYSNMQICGNDDEITVSEKDGVIWVHIGTLEKRITMNDTHVRQLAAALASFRLNRDTDTDKVEGAE